MAEGSQPRRARRDDDTVGRDGLVPSPTTSPIITMRRHSGTSTHTVAMNKSAWERLSTKSKSILDKFGGEYIARLAGKGFDTRNASHVAKFMKEKKRTFIIPDKKQFAAARRSVQPVYDEWIKKNS